MDPEEEFDPMSSIRMMMEEMKFRNEAFDKMKAIADIEKEKAEREIMMDLWGWLGNNTETYTEAFCAIADYHKALKATRKHIVGRAHNITVKLAESLAQQVLLDVELYKKMETVCEEIETNRPK